VSKRELVYRAVAELRPRENNPRTHSKKQIEQLARSITRFGFTNPILIDDDGYIIAGHGRVEAAKLVDMAEVPTLLLSGMTSAEVRAYVIADNKLAENAGWDRGLLKAEFQYLAELDFDFDLGLTGFELPEIDAFMGEDSKAEREDPLDALPAPSQLPAVTRRGDIWQIGPHRLICEDSTQAETYVLLLGQERAAMVFADPPYNVPIAGHVSGLGKAKHREFAMAFGEMTSDEFTSFLATVFVLLAAVSKDGAMHFQCIDWRHAKEMLAAGGAAYSELKNICVWAKTNGGMGSLYRSAHELVFVWKAGQGAHVNNVELGKHGRYRTNVWTYAGANSFSSTREDDLASHPTVKPVTMIADAILDCSRRKDLILDPFAGSGTTLIAAHKTGRRGYGVEIDPAYCDLIVRRLTTVVKHAAILVGDERTFDEIAADRHGEITEVAA